MMNTKDKKRMMNTNFNEELKRKHEFNFNEEKKILLCY